MLSVTAGFLWIALVIVCIAAELTQVRAKAAIGMPYSILMAFVRIAGDSILTLIVMTLIWAFLGPAGAFLVTLVILGGYLVHRAGEVMRNMAVEHYANAVRTNEQLSLALNIPTPMAQSLHQFSVPTLASPASTPRYVQTPPTPTTASVPAAHPVTDESPRFREQISADDDGWRESLLDEEPDSDLDEHGLPPLEVYNNEEAQELRRILHANLEEHNHLYNRGELLDVVSRAEWMKSHPEFGEFLEWYRSEHGQEARRESRDDMMLVIEHYLFWSWI